MVSRLSEVMVTPETRRGPQGDPVIETETGTVEAPSLSKMTHMVGVDFSLDPSEYNVVPKHVNLNPLFTMSKFSKRTFSFELIMRITSLLICRCKTLA